jgi:hypothetical protein
MLRVQIPLHAHQNNSNNHIARSIVEIIGIAIISYTKYASGLALFGYRKTNFFKTLIKGIYIITSVRILWTAIT